MPHCLIPIIANVATSDRRIRFINSLPMTQWCWFGLHILHRKHIFKVLVGKQGLPCRWWWIVTPTSFSIIYIRMFGRHLTLWACMYSQLFIHPSDATEAKQHPRSQTKRRVIILLAAITAGWLNVYLLMSMVDASRSDLYNFQLSCWVAADYHIWWTRSGRPLRKCIFLNNCLADKRARIWVRSKN